MVSKKENNSFKEVFVPRNGMYVVVDTRPATVSSLGYSYFDQIRIYPNPSEGMLKIESPEGKKLFDEVEILNLTGKVLKKYPSYQNTYEFNLPDGIYIVKLRSKNKLVKTEKILMSK